MTDLSGSLATQVLTKTGSPYNVTAHATIADGATVQAEPGVEIVFTGNYYLDNIVSGILRLMGTRNDPIVVRGRGRDMIAGQGIICRALTAGLRWDLHHVRISDCKYGLYLPDTVSGYGEIVLDDVVIRNCENGIQMERPTSITATFLSTDPVRVMGPVTIEECGIGLYSSPSNAARTAIALQFESTGKLVLRRNRFGILTNNSAQSPKVVFHRATGKRDDPADALELIDVGQVLIYDNTVGAAVARSEATLGLWELRNVWWGSDDGPEDSGFLGSNYTKLNGVGDRIESILEANAANNLKTNVVQLARYVHDPDILRVFLGGLGSSYNQDLLKTSRFTDLELDDILKRAEMKLDAAIEPGMPRTKRLFARGTETNEEQPLSTSGAYILRYPIVTTMTTVQRRTGNATWGTVSQGEDTGWYMGDDDELAGQVWINQSWASYRRAAFRFTYTHGYVQPHKVPELVDMTLRVAALEAIGSAFFPNVKTDAQTMRLQAEVDAWVARWKARRTALRLAVVRRF